MLYISSGVWVLCTLPTLVKIFFIFESGDWNKWSSQWTTEREVAVQTLAGAEFFRQKIQLSCPQENGVCRMIHMKQDDAGS